METTLRKTAALLLATYYLSSRHSVQAVLVGDEVCITGYIMDNYCIEKTGGVLLDNSDVITLQHPEEHSFHCLLDVSFCYNSGFTVLGEKDPDTERHCLGFRLDDIDTVLEVGRSSGKMGYCSSCKGTGDANPDFGYQATVRGTVKELGDGTEGVTGTPVLTDFEMLDSSVGCDGNPTVPPLCMARSSSFVETAVPSPSPIDVSTNLFATGTVQACPDTLNKSMVIDSKATLHYAMVPSNPPGSQNGLLCGRLEVENDGWIGLAISETGQMSRSVAIIGLPNDDTVRKYELFGWRPYEMPEEKQTLRDTSIVEEDEMTVIEFTKMLLEDGEISILEEGDNIFLHARGGSSLGYHGGGRLPFTMDFSTSAAAPTLVPSVSPVIVPSASPTLPPVTLSPSGSPVKSLTGSPTAAPIATMVPLSPSGSPVKSLTGSPTSAPIATMVPTPLPSMSPKTLPSASNVPPTLTVMSQTDGSAAASSASSAPSTSSTDSRTPAANPESSVTLPKSPTGSPSTPPYTDSPMIVAPTMNPVAISDDASAMRGPADISDSGILRLGALALLVSGISVALSVCLF